MDRELKVKTLFYEIMGEDYKITEKIKRLGGMNNKNYKIETNKNNFVFRFPGKGSNESVNRDSEVYNANIARKIGIDCKTIYFDKDTGLKITEYIKDAVTLTLETSTEESNMALMAYSLNKLHNSNEKFYKDFKPFNEIKDYKKIITEKNHELLQNYKELDSVIKVLEDEMEKLIIEYVPCHLDAWPENFVKNDSQVYLIDWEYSSNYDRLWDVVSIGLECEYSKEQDDIFKRKYFRREPSVIEIKKMSILKVLMDVYWSMWSLAKVSCGEIDLYDYSKTRYNRAISNLKNIKIL